MEAAVYLIWHYPKKRMSSTQQKKQEILIAIMKSAVLQTTAILMQKLKATLEIAEPAYVIYQEVIVKEMLHLCWIHHFY